MFTKYTRLIYLLLLLAAGLIIKYLLIDFISEDYGQWVRLGASFIILYLGAVYILRGTAEVIEETTEVLSEKTKLAGGLLQSLGTAFPDMVLGILAAFVSLKLRSTDMGRAINFAIIAAAVTFGSNIYNIAHATWCIFRQNLANKKVRVIAMFPYLGKGGAVKPMQSHAIKPNLAEFETAIDVSVALTMLTGIVALSMVLFGQWHGPATTFKGDLYQLIRPVGIIIFLLCLIILYFFRKTKRGETTIPAVAAGENYYRQAKSSVIWASLLVAALAILLAAESMVGAIEAICEITNLPFVVAGVLAGIIGCLGEMMVVHNFTVNPKGRIGDAVVGVAMDNIVTIMGASIVAIMGGIFLGGNSLILIFVIIFCLNTLLIWQISRLKNYFLKSS